MRTAEKIDAVQDLVLSQEDRPQPHRSTRQISRETGISQPTVVWIIHEDLKLKCLKKRHAQQLSKNNKDTRLERCKKLLRKFPEESVDFIWFTDEKVFTVAPPINAQNDRLYVSKEISKHKVDAKRLLRTRSTFSRSVMVSVTVSKLKNPKVEGLYSSQRGTFQTTAKLKSYCFLVLLINNFSSIMLICIYVTQTLLTLKFRKLVWGWLLVHVVNVYIIL
jgi:hypothetical protein